MKKVPLAFAILLGSMSGFFTSLVAQNPAASQNGSRKFDVRPDALEQYRNRSIPKTSSSTSSPRSNNPDFMESDMGIQRPVEAKKTGFGYHLGFETKVYHSSNPASVDGGDFEVSAGIWENALRNNFLLGAYDLGGASFSPVLSLTYVKFNHFGDDLFDTFDFDSLGLSFAGIFQFSNGLTLRSSLAYNADLNPNHGLKRQYSQISPNLALGKSFSLDPVSAFVEWSIGYSFTDNPSGLDDDGLNRFETALTGGLTVPFGNFEFSPLLRFALVDYSKENRTDVMSSLNLQLQYAFTQWLKLKVYANMSARNSDVPNSDFSRFDTGAGASFDARF